MVFARRHDRVDTMHDYFNILAFSLPTERIANSNATGVVTPLLAALPMFMGGAGLIGFLARRRKQKTKTRTHLDRQGKPAQAGTAHSAGRPEQELSRETSGDRERYLR